MEAKKTLLVEELTKEIEQLKAKLFRVASSMYDLKKENNKLVKDVAEWVAIATDRKHDLIELQKTIK